MFEYFFRQKLSKSRLIMGWVAISIIVVSYFMTWKRGTLTAFVLHDGSNTGYIIKFSIPLILLGCLICLILKSKLLVLGGVSILIFLWFPGLYALDNYHWYSGPILMNIGASILILNQFLPEDIIAKPIDWIQNH